MLMSDATDGLVCAYLLPAGMAWKKVGRPEVESWTAAAGLLWMHLDLTSAATRRYIKNASKINELEAEVLNTQSRDLRHSLAEVRQQTIALRRYLSPQRDAKSRLQTEEFS